MAETYTYCFGSTTGSLLRDKVRLLSGDTDNISKTSGTQFLFSDNEIDSFIWQNGSNEFLSAAQVIDTVRMNPLKLHVRFRNVDGAVDIPGMAKQLGEVSKSLRDKAYTEGFSFTFQPLVDSETEGISIAGEDDYEYFEKD